MLTEEDIDYRFDLYGALWLLCNRWHSGQNSRGYRLLSRLCQKGYQPGHGLQNGHFEGYRQRYMYKCLFKLRHTL